MADGPTGVGAPTYYAAPPPPPPAPQARTGERLTETQVRETAQRVLEEGGRLLTDDYDGRLDKFAETMSGLDADSRARVFAEVLRQDGGAIHSWLQADRFNGLVADGRISAAERGAVMEGLAGAYNNGQVKYMQVRDFLGAPIDRAPGWAADRFQGARALFSSSNSAEMLTFRERYAGDAFQNTAARAARGFNMPSMESAFAATLLADGAGSRGVARVFAGLEREQQRAVAGEIAYASIGYRNSQGAVPNLPDPLRTLADGIAAITPATSQAGRQLLGNVAAGALATRQPELATEATRLYRQIAEGAAQERRTDPQGLAGGLRRVNEATSAAERVFASFPPNASKDQIYQVVSRTYATLTAPTFAQYLELRGDAARSLSGAALRNEIGLGMGVAPNNVPQTPEQQRAFGRGEWDYFSGREAAAVRAVEAQINAVGGPGARVAVLPVTMESHELGGIVQVPLYRVETAQGETRFVDYNPATGEARTYSDFQDWRDNNKLPPGRMTCAENGHLTADEHGRARVVTENTPGTPDTFWERWGQPVLDGAALVGGVVLVGAAIVGTGGTALLVGGALLGAYGAYRGGEVIADRATHGQTVNPLDSAEARNAWLNVGAGVVGLAAVGATMRAASLAGRAAGGLDDAARALTAANTARATNVAAQYADTAAMVDTGYSLAANWDRLTPQQRLTALAQMAFWTGGTAVSARQAGGVRNLYGVGDMADGLARANQWMRGQFPSGTEIKQVFTNAADAVRALDPRSYEVRRLTTPEGLTLHAIVRRGEDGNAPRPLETRGPRGSGRVETNGLPPALRNEFPNAERVTVDARGRINGLENAGPNAPKFQRWINELGGEVFYDRATRTHIYAVDMPTQANPSVTERVAVPYRIDAGGNARADFSAYSQHTTSIDPSLPKDRPTHFTEANRNLAAAMNADPTLRGRLGLSDEVYNMITREPPGDRSPPPYTWHHVDGEGNMMLVDFAIHQRFTHFGGFSEWANN